MDEGIQWRAIVPAALVVVLLGALLFVPPRGGVDVALAPGQEAAGVAGDPNALPGAAGSVPGLQPPGTAGSTVPGAGGVATGASAAGGPAAAAGVAGSPSATGGPSGAAPPGAATGSSPAAAAKATYPGVTDKQILVGFAYQQEGCGGYDSNAILTGLGINNDIGEQFLAAVKLFNERPVQALELTKKQAKYLRGTPGLYGRKVKPKLYNDFGPACEEAGRAMAVKAVEQDNIFAMVQDGSFGTEPWISEEVAARKRLHVGNSVGTEGYYNKRGGYAWDARWGQGDKAAVATASWVCRDLAGRNASDTGDPLVAGQPRKFGMIRFDTPDAAAVAQGVKAELARCGAELAVEVAESTDVAVSQQQTQSAMVRMRQEGVTSIFVHVDWTNTTTATQTASKQNYNPEWLISSYYQGDWASRVYYFYDKQHQRNFMGTTHIYSHHQPKHDTTYEYRMWKLAFPERDQPEVGWREIVFQVRALFRGIYGAGPELTPDRWAQGLRLFCDPCARTDPKLPLEILRPGHHSNWADFGIIKWDPNRIDNTEIDGVEGGYRRGWWRFLDKGRRYIGTVRQRSDYVTR